MRSDIEEGFFTVVRQSQVGTEVSQGLQLLYFRRNIAEFHRLCRVGFKIVTEESVNGDVVHLIALHIQKRNYCSCGDAGELSFFEVENVEVLAHLFFHIRGVEHQKSAVISHGFMGKVDALDIRSNMVSFKNIRYYSGLRFDVFAEKFRLLHRNGFSGKERISQIENYNKQFFHLRTLYCFCKSLNDNGVNVLFAFLRFSSLTVRYFHLTNPKSWC